MRYPGDYKFQVTASQEDFDLHEDSWEIHIKNQRGLTKYRLPKGDCFWDSDGNYYFALENLRPGIYYAYFYGSYEDEDYDDQRRRFSDIQKLIEIGLCPSRTRGCKCKHVVQYQEVTTVSIDGDDYLCGKDGKYILTSDGKRICFKSEKRKQIDDMGKVVLDTMTGDEFKQFVEGKNPDGRIDTLPEMLDAARGISDDTTIKEDVDEQINEQLEEQAATDEDIDEMFSET